MFGNNPSGIFDPASADADWTILQTGIALQAGSDVPLAVANAHRIAIAFSGAVNSVVWIYNTASISDKQFWPIPPNNSTGLISFAYSQWGGLVARNWFAKATGIGGGTLNVTEVLWLPH